ncbi:MAG: hypothetical protein ACRCZD_13185 [Phycicoccus sp.]
MTDPRSVHEVVHVETHVPKEYPVAYNNTQLTEDEVFRINAALIDFNDTKEAIFQKLSAVVMDVYSDRTKQDGPQIAPATQGLLSYKTYQERINRDITDFSVMINNTIKTTGAAADDTARSSNRTDGQNVAGQKQVYVGATTPG